MNKKNRLFLLIISVSCVSACAKQHGPEEAFENQDLQMPQSDNVQESDEDAVDDTDSDTPEEDITEEDSENSEEDSDDEMN